MNPVGIKFALIFQLLHMLAKLDSRSLDGPLWKKLTFLLDCKKNGYYTLFAQAGAAE